MKAGSNYTVEYEGDCTAERAEYDTVDCLAPGLVSEIKLGGDGGAYQVKPTARIEAGASQP